MSPLRTLAAIVDATARVRAVADRLERLGPDGFVAALDTLARDASLGATPADVDAMLACALWILNDGAPRIDELVAVSSGSAVANALLDDGGEGAHKALANLGRLLEHGGSNRLRRETREYKPGSKEMLAFYIEERSTTWANEPAMIRWLESAEARIREAVANGEPLTEGTSSKVPLPPTHIAMQLERLARRPDQASIQVLLNERATTKKQVLKVAARRPTTPAMVAQLVAHTSWMSHLEVRVSLLENPFTPLRTALLLLPTCRSRLSVIATGKADVHARVRAAAKMLLGRT